MTTTQITAKLRSLSDDQLMWDTEEIEDQYAASGDRKLAEILDLAHAEERRRGLLV